MFIILPLVADQYNNRFLSKLLSSHFSAIFVELLSFLGLHLGLQAITIFVKNKIHASACMLRFFIKTAVLLFQMAVGHANRHLIWFAVAKNLLPHFQITSPPLLISEYRLWLCIFYNINHAKFLNVIYPIRKVVLTDGKLFTGGFSCENSWSKLWSLFHQYWTIRVFKTRCPYQATVSPLKTLAIYIWNL